MNFLSIRICQANVIGLWKMQTVRKLILYIYFWRRWTPRRSVLIESCGIRKVQLMFFQFLWSAPALPHPTHPLHVRLVQTHHLSHEARGQSCMWATVACLKVTTPDRSNLCHPRQQAWWMRLSSFYPCPCPWSRIDRWGAAWWAVPTSNLHHPQKWIQAMHNETDWEVTSRMI